jgi:hypothetical protein
VRVAGGEVVLETAESELAGVERADLAGVLVDAEHGGGLRQPCWAGAGIDVA